jgi:replicative DNA helicase
MTDQDVRQLAWAGLSSPAAVDFSHLPNEPRNPSAESATLGALMLSPRCVDQLLPVLRVDHFTSRPHQDTFAAIEAVHAAGKPVDPLLVNDELRKQGRISWGEVKVSVFVHACLEATYFPGHGTSYAAAVIECAARRRILQAGVRIAQAAARGATELPDLMRLVAGEVRDTVDRVAVHETLVAAHKTPVPVGTVIDGLRKQLEPAPASLDPPPFKADDRSV